MALCSVQSAILRRNLNFSVFAVRTMIGYAIGGCAAITMALAGWGVLSLVMVQVCQYGTTLVMVWCSSDWRPKLLFSSAALRNLLSFSAHFASGNCMALLTSKLDILIIGVFMDAAAVGYYMLSLRIVDTVIAITITPIWVVMMPVLSRMTHVPERFSDAFIRAVMTASMVVVPLLIGLAGIAPAFIPTIFGAEWQPSARVLQPMALAAFTMGLIGFSGPALSAQGQPGVFLKVTMAQMVITAILFAVAAQFSVTAVGLAFFLTSTVSVPVHFIALRRIGINIKRLVWSWVPILASGCLMAAWAWLWQGDWIVVAVGGTMFYFVTLEVSSHLVSECAKLISEALFGRRPA
jgi:O-antigen/teichoic acid export membrane protein